MDCLRYGGAWNQRRRQIHASLIENYSRTIARMMRSMLVSEFLLPPGLDKARQLAYPVVERDDGDAEQKREDETMQPVADDIASLRQQLDARSEPHFGLRSE